MATRRLLPYFLTNVKSQSETDRLRSIFRMSPAKIFVGGLANDYNDVALKNLFSRHGDIVEASIAVDRNTGIQRNFGFVVFSNLSSASAAVSAMDGVEIGGQFIRVKLAS